MHNPDRPGQPPAGGRRPGARLTLPRPISSFSLVTPAAPGSCTPPHPAPRTAMATTSRTDAVEMLRDALEANGQRLTEQRAAVYRFLASSSDHPTADEVFTAVRGEISDISLATVYKALETLVGCGLVIKLASLDGSARYDANTEDHYHARCVVCGAVRDVHTASVSGGLPKIEPGDGFHVHGYRLEVLGHCATCAP